MINVLHLIDHYRVGGPGKTIINTAKYIDRKIFTLHIGSFLPVGNETELSSEIEKNRIALLPLKDTRGFSFKNFQLLSRYIDLENISILHSHGYKADIYGILLCIFRRNLIVLTTHHGWIRNTITQVILGGTTLKLSFLFAHTILVSKEMKRHLSRYALKKKKYSIIHNAIRIEDYRPQGNRDEHRKLINVNKDDIVLLSVGRLSKEKGCLNLLNAFNKIYKKNKNIKLVYVGDGPIMDIMKNQIDELNLTRSVILSGHHRVVQPYYEAADIFICPSDTEGLSNVILEAMAYSLPVVATEVGGNPEIIKDQMNGLLVPPQNALALANAINILVLNPDMRTLLGRSGYDTIVDKFSFSMRTQKIEDLYMKLLKEKRQSVF